MTIQQCKYIVKIAECGSLNEAAKQLFVAQSSLSVSVRSLENELNITIFERSGNGVYLTNEGAEFVRYARQIAEQASLVEKRYAGDVPRKQLYISTQHYDFVADIFAKLLNETEEASYRFSLREMKTYDVIHETEKALCDIGIIAIKSKDRAIMGRYISQYNLQFTPLLQAKPHVYVRREHPLAECTVIKPEMLKAYPYVSYEQGEHTSTFFTEEIVSEDSEKQVEISDRASLMNVLLATDCYTVGTGLMPSLLNGGRIVSVPFDCEEFYTIGYLLRKDRAVSESAATFLTLLQETMTEN